MKIFEIQNRRYIGCKTKLLNFINEVIIKENIKFESFLDLFAGTGIVGDYFNNENTKVFFNDILSSNYVSYQAWFGYEDYDLDKILNYINTYNNIAINEDNYFSLNFSNTYFSMENCKKIGYIRENIENNYKNNKINARERAILITSLLYAMDKIANTVGHYDAYRKNGDLNKKLELCMLNLKANEVNENDLLFNVDSNTLVRNIYADVVYIDPPYNSRQYSDAYHLLENVTNWEKKEVFGVAKKMNRKELKSKYCSVSAPLVFKDLIENINAKYIIVSYNNMGKKGAGRSQAKISDDDIMNVLSKKGSVSVYETDFKEFTTGKTNIEGHKERLFVCKIGDVKELNDTTKISITSNVKSPLNYTGGKYKILDQILPLFPKNIDLFIDMFCGGANVGVNINAKKIICIDKQNEVIRIMNLFKEYDDSYIIDLIEKVIKKYNLSNSLLNGYQIYNTTSDAGLGNYNKDKFLKLREDYNNLYENNIEKDILFLTLIIYGFNNQIRFNKDNKFNMPVGKRDFNNSLRKNLKNFINKIKTKDITFFCNDFRNYNIDNKCNTLVYCDPPYLIATASYNENGGWTTNDEKDLLSYLSNLDKKGIKFALSNVIYHKGNKNNILDDWIKLNNYNVNYINKNYNNSNYHKLNNDNLTVEVLVTNYNLNDEVVISTNTFNNLNINNDIIKGKDLIFTENIEKLEKK